MRLSESIAIPCPFQEPCCMKENGKCTVLTDTRFKDNKCHFRKLFPIARMSTTRKGEQMRREDFLNKVADIVTKDRNNQYGEPEDSVKVIAKLWSIWLDKEIEEYDVAVLMILMKVARMKHKVKEDSWLDIAGYSSLGSELCDDVKVVKK